MQELLNHPAVQGGIAPFVIALIVALLLQRMRLSGLAIIAGFMITAYLVTGISFEPLTATRKIVLLGLLSAGLSLPLTFFHSRWLRPVLVVAGGSTTVWVVLRILQQQDTTLILLWGVGCALYVGWLVFWLDSLNDSSLRAGSAGMALGVGTGGAALFGASALLGQFGLALGAAAGAYLLIQMVSSKPLSCGHSFTLPLSIVAGLTACVAVLTAQLPWYALLLIAGIPVAAKMPLPGKWPLWFQSILLSGATLTCAAVAIYLTWRIAGSPPI